MSDKNITNEDIAGLLDRIADLLEAQDEKKPPAGVTLREARRRIFH